MVETANNSLLRFLDEHFEHTLLIIDEYGYRYEGGERKQKVWPMESMEAGT